MAGSPLARDPRAVLGVGEEATPEELTAAYRRAARRWHPDRAAEAGASDRMAEVNAAYELLRSGLWQQRRHPARRPARAGAGDAVPAAVRRALGPELAAALRPGEAVCLVTPAATWTSPQTILAATTERLLWLLDDAPVHRVRFARYRDLAEVGVRAPRLRRSTAELRARTHGGRRLAFSELRPATAEALAARARKNGVSAADYP